VCSLLQPRQRHRHNSDLFERLTEGLAEVDHSAANVLAHLPTKMCSCLVFAATHLQVQEGHTVNNWLAATGPVAFAPYFALIAFPLTVCRAPSLLLSRLY
jgi:hypothetical protein